MLNSGELAIPFIGVNYDIDAEELPDIKLGVLEKRKVYGRAKWFDVKNLCANITGLHLTEIYVESINDSAWRGWIVEFKSDVHMAELQRNLSQCLVVGKRAIFIGIY